MISDLRPGRELRAEGGMVRHCYNHLLPEAFRGKLRLYAQHSPEYDLIQSKLWKDEEKIGYIEGAWYEDESVVPGVVRLENRYRGKGLGSALYEALYVHSYHLLGIRAVEGDHHSGAAHRVHKRLTLKHRMPGYRTRSGYGVAEYGPYRYELR